MSTRMPKGAALSPWFPASINPARPGVYRVQDTSMGCGCCWIDARWNGADWHTACRCSGGKCNVWNTLMLNVKRWRGLAAPARSFAALYAKLEGTPEYEAIKASVARGETE